MVRNGRIEEAGRKEKAVLCWRLPRGGEGRRKEKIVEGSEQKGVNYWNCYITQQHLQCESAERAADTSRSKQTVRREVDKRRKILLVAHKVCGGVGWKTGGSAR